MADRTDRQPSLEQHVRPGLPLGLALVRAIVRLQPLLLNCAKVAGRKHDDHGQARSITSSITSPTYGLLPFAWSMACCNSCGARSSARRKSNTLSFALALSMGAKWEHKAFGPQAI